MESTWWPIHLVVISYWVGRSTLVRVRLVPAGTAPHSPVKEEERTPFDIRFGSDLMQFEIHYRVTCSCVSICLALCRDWGLGSAVVFYHKGEFNNTDVHINRSDVDLPVSERPFKLKRSPSFFSKWYLHHVCWQVVNTEGCVLQTPRLSLINCDFAGKGGAASPKILCITGKNP